MRYQIFILFVSIIITLFSFLNHLGLIVIVQFGLSVAKAAEVDTSDCIVYSLCTEYIIVKSICYFPHIFEHAMDFLVEIEVSICNFSHNAEFFNQNVSSFVYV